MNYTTLKNRKLYFDGDSIVEKEYIYDKLLKLENVNNLFIETIDKEIDFYNKNFDPKLQVKENYKNLDISWNIPKNYLNINLKKYLLEKFEIEINNSSFSEIEINNRLDRINYEYNLWKNNNLLDLLSTIVFIVDNFKQNDVVWGTGRGSSCSCYILYLIGLHDVDSVLYNLDISEFFR